MKNGCSTLTLLSIYATIFECLTIALVTYTEVSLIGFNDTAHRHPIHDTNKTITDLMSPQECGILVYSANFGTLTNREAMQEAGNKLFPHRKVLLGVVEDTISRDRELLTTMFADETRTTIGMNTILAHAFTLRSTMRANKTVGEFCINNKLEVRRRRISRNEVNKFLSF